MVTNGYLKVMEAFSEALGKYGVKVNMDKSRNLKTNGKWIHRVKFLGMVYNPFSDV